MKKQKDDINKYNAYKNLTPNYHFEVRGNVAIGTLPDGTKFKIDSDKVKLVSKYFFHLNEKGYIYTLKSKTKNCNLRLHWLVLGYTSRPDFIVDHINRDKTDCRVSNLRLVTKQQNSMNRKLTSTNKTGYLGVHINRKKDGTYQGRICINYHRITLLGSPDPVLCAQAYNYASELLFGEFCGYRNPVPEASLALKKHIEKKCQKYLQAAAEATKKVAI